MPRPHPAYPQEYRKRIIELARAGRSPDALAREFEPTAQTIRNWVKQADLDEGFRHDGLTTAEREELRKRRRDNRRLAEETSAKSVRKPLWRADPLFFVLLALFAIAFVMPLAWSVGRSQPERVFLVSYLLGLGGGGVGAVLFAASSSPRRPEWLSWVLVPLTPTGGALVVGLLTRSRIVAEGWFWGAAVTACLGFAVVDIATYAARLKWRAIDSAYDRACGSDGIEGE